MSVKIISLLTVLYISFASATEVEECKNAPLPIFVDVEECEKGPCNLYNNGSVVVDITFKGLTISHTLKTSVKAYVGPIGVTYPLPGDLSNACLYLVNGYCPIEKDEVLVYRLELPINYPKVKVGLEFSLVGDNGFVFQCFKVSCVVNDPRPPVLSNILN